MSTGSKSTTTQSTKLDPELSAAYSGILSQEGNLANSNYSGELTAGLTDAQKQATSQLGNISTTSNPYYTQASSLLQAGSTPTTVPDYVAPNFTYSAPDISYSPANLSYNPADLSFNQVTPYDPTFDAAAVDQYMSPYTNDVINSTLGVLNEQNAQQQNQLRGSTAAAGALGSDRAGIAQAALMGQQSLANNSTIANLYNQAYAQALGQYNTVVGQKQTETGQAISANAQNLTYDQLLQAQAGQGLTYDQLLQAQAGQQLDYGNQKIAAANLGLSHDQLLLGASGQQLTAQGQQLTAEEANKQAQLSAAGTYAGLGSADVANQLATNEALMNAGTVQQQTAQNADTAAYQKYLQQYTNLADLASVLGSAASATSPQVSTTNKQTSIIKRGGRVPHRADGGFLPAPSVDALYARQPFNVTGPRSFGTPPADTPEPSMLDKGASRAKSGFETYSAMDKAGLFGSSPAPTSSAAPSTTALVGGHEALTATPAMAPAATVAAPASLGEAAGTGAAVSGLGSAGAGAGASVAGTAGMTAADVAAAGAAAEAAGSGAAALGAAGTAGTAAAGTAAASGSGAAASGLGESLMSLFAFLKSGGRVPHLSGGGIFGPGGLFEPPPEMQRFGNDMMRGIHPTGQSDDAAGGGAIHLGMGGTPIITRDLLQQPIRHPLKAASLAGAGTPHPTRPVSVAHASVPRLRTGFGFGGDTGNDDDVNVIPVPIPRPATLADAANTDRLASSEEVPHFWNDFSTHTGDAPASLADAAKSEVAPAPQAQAQAPESFLQRIGATQGPGTGTGVNYQPGSPGWGLPLLAMIGKGMADRSIGSGIAAGVGEYARESELDAKPTVDNSGPTSRIYYPSEKKWVDTGLPTEVSIYRDYQHQYQQAMLPIHQQNADTTTDKADAQAAYWQAMAANAANKANNGAQPVQTYMPWTQDGTSGVLRLPTKGGELPSFLPMAGNKTVASKDILPAQALDQARKDYEMYRLKAPDYDPNTKGSGTVYNADGSVADPVSWVSNRAGHLLNGVPGGAAVTAPAHAPTAGNAQRRSAMPPAGFSKAPDGKYYAPDPRRPGKYVMWTP